MHQEVKGLLAAYHDEELDPSRQQQIEQHLAACPACRQALTELEQIKALLTAHPLPASLQGVDLWPQLSALLGQPTDTSRSRASHTRVRQQKAGDTGRLPALANWLAPAGMLLGQAMLQAVGLVALLSALLLAWGSLTLDQLLPAIPQALDLPQVREGAAGLPWKPWITYLSLPSGSEQIVGLLLPTLLLTLFSAGLALLYLAWLTWWWQQRAHHRS